METMEKIMAIGEKLGHKGEALQRFLKEEMERIQKTTDDELKREERRMQREQQKLEMEDREREAQRKREVASRELGFALLKGRALEVYSRMTTEDALDYSKLKDRLLKRYNLTEEGYRKDSIPVDLKV
jgi:predicted transcriptional regulator